MKKSVYNLCIYALGISALMDVLCGGGIIGLVSNIYRNHCITKDRAALYKALENTHYEEVTEEEESN